MSNPIDVIAKLRLVPVVKLERVEDAVPLAKALIAAGLPVAEVTYRTDAAEACIAEMSKAFPEMLVGAGTILTTDQVDSAKKSGAKFIVTPGFNPEVVDYCQQVGLPVTPGCITPSEVEQALKRGIEVVKFFPAEAAGGIPFMKAMSGPYDQVRFIPTGGISLKNLKEYALFKKVLAVGGSWIVDTGLIKEGKFDQITKLTKEALEIVKQ